MKGGTVEEERNGGTEGGRKKERDGEIKGWRERWTEGGREGERKIRLRKVSAMIES